jgi:uncharacterized protein YjiS (DUF1127 family)
MALAHSTEIAPIRALRSRSFKKLWRLLLLLRGYPARATRPLRTWHQLGEERRHLADLSDRDLKDIGLSRDDVADAAPPPHWLR